MIPVSSGRFALAETRLLALLHKQTFPKLSASRSAALLALLGQKPHRTLNAPDALRAQRQAEQLGGAHSGKINSWQAGVPRR